MRQSCEQLMEENNAKEKLLEAQRSREQQLSDEVSSLQKQVFTLEAKREELQSLLSLSRQNIRYPHFLLCSQHSRLQCEEKWKQRFVPSQQNTHSLQTIFFLLAS